MKPFKLFSVGIAIAAASVAAHATPVVWSVNGNSYEVFGAQGISWADAKASAVAKGGHLVTITSEAEDAFVYGLIKQSGLGEVWAGGFRTLLAQPTSVSETGPALSGWSWVTGEAWVYSNWAPGEPNDYYQGNPPEVELGLNWGTLGGGHWNDEGALGNIRGYVVEKVGVPDGGATVMLLGLGLLGLAALRRR